MWVLNIYYFLLYNLVFISCFLDGGSENQKIFIIGGRHDLNKYQASGILVTRYYFSPEKRPSNFYLTYNQAAMLIQAIQFILEKKNHAHLIIKQNEDQYEDQKWKTI